MNSLKQIGIEINKVLNEKISVEDKINFTYKLMLTVDSIDKKPTYELWEKAIKDNTSSLSIDSITDYISLVTLVEPEFASLPHMEFHSFLRKINPNAKKMEVSSLEKEKIKKEFNSFLKKKN